MMGDGAVEPVMAVTSPLSSDRGVETGLRVQRTEEISLRRGDVCLACGTFRLEHWHRSQRGKLSFLTLLLKGTQVSRRGICTFHFNLIMREGSMLILDIVK